jgi:hypothetical protein
MVKGRAAIGAMWKGLAERTSGVHPMLRRKHEIIMLAAAVAFAIVILAAGATRESTEAGNHRLPVASHNRIDPATMQLKVDIFNLHRATVDLPY